MKKCIKLSAALISAVLLSGCGSEASSLPDDTPFNCGKFAVMETEKGYYTNTDTANGHILGYWERDTDKYVYLCAKPECTHDGSENCTATYKNLKCINTLLYDGAIYTLAIEDGDNIRYSLYKAALDGTSFTKVGDAFSVSNSAGESYSIMNKIYFMIHRGYAYIPYHLTLGDSTFGFAGSGLVKMDIRTGKTETLFSGDDYFSAYPMKEMGVGDYVYYFAGSSTNNDPNEGTYRYNTETGETDKLADHINGIVMDEEHYYDFGAYDDGSYCIMSLDIDSPTFDGKWENLGGRINDGLHMTENGCFSFMPKLMLYEDKIAAVSTNENDILIMSKSGEVLGSGKYDFNEISGYSGELFKEYNISEGKLYVNIRALASPYNDNEQKVFSIPLSDIGSENGSWKFEYGIKSQWQINQETGGDTNADD